MGRVVSSSLAGATFGGFLASTITRYSAALGNQLRLIVDRLTQLAILFLEGAERGTR